MSSFSLLPPPLRRPTYPARSPTQADLTRCWSVLVGSVAAPHYPLSAPVDIKYFAVSVSAGFVVVPRYPLSAPVDLKYVAIVPPPLDLIYNLLHARLADMNLSILLEPCSTPLQVCRRRTVVAPPLQHNLFLEQT
ncbi:hypothetical protein F5888DRAFT_1806532 [Russula emetica]|nr:hypothetical protein F5888DRAFT_1806532 [Russula emetica]